MAINWEKGVLGMISWPVRTARDYGYVARLLPEYVHMGVSPQYWFHIRTRALFASFDAFKTTSPVRVLMEAMPEGRDSEGNPIQDIASDGRPRNWVYKVGRGENAKPVKNTQAHLGLAFHALGAIKRTGLVNANASNIDANLDVYSEATKSFQVAINSFGNDLNSHAQSLKNIEADPAKTPLIVGGTIVARLAAFDAKPHFTRLNDIYTELAELSNAIRQYQESKSDRDKSSLLAQLQRFKVYDDVSKKSEAETAFSEFVKPFEKATVIQDGGGRRYGNGLFGNPTNWGIRQNAGRVERDITAEDKERYKQLMDSGRVVFLNSLDYRPAEDVYTEPDGNNGNKPDWQKFFEFAYARRQALESPPSEPQKYSAMIGFVNEDLLLNATKGLKNGDYNRVIEAFKWIAVQYSSGGKSGEESDRYWGINEKLPGFIKSAADKALWDPETLELVEHMRATMEAMGPNNYRKVWTEVWHFVRNRRYDADHKNELGNRNAPNEFRGAQEWAYGIGIKNPISKRMAEKGRPYYNYVYPITKPLNTLWDVAGGRKLVGDTIKRAWKHKFRTTLAFAGSLVGIWAVEQAVETQTGELNLNAAQRIGGVPLKAADLTLGSIFRGITGSQAHIPGHNWTFQRLFGQDPVSGAKALEQDIASMRSLVKEAKAPGSGFEPSMVEKFEMNLRILEKEHKLVTAIEEDNKLQVKLMQKSSLTPQEQQTLSDIGTRITNNVDKLQKLENYLDKVNQSIRDSNTPLPAAPDGLLSKAVNISDMFNAKPSGNVTAPGGMLAAIFSGGTQGNVKTIKKTPMYGDAKPGTDSPEHTIA